MSILMKQASREYTHTDSLTWNQIGIGAAQRSADALESLLSVVHSFPGCQMARDIHRMAREGITVRHRHEYTVHFAVTWPWGKKRKRGKK